MARNSEKAQSMLYRFREQQAVEMGMGNRARGDRRPRMASSVSSLRECERWRGDILKEISRKVSKIQDSTLTDYEVRDLNDVINQLMREKRHWETQIVNLGGANYKRGQQAMLDDEGREVPGTRGYKYFGRARDLPGVKELFTKSAQAATEESARNSSFQMFRNQGPEYFGDIDELDHRLADEENRQSLHDWDISVQKTADVLSIEDHSALPTYPQRSHQPQPNVGAGTSKRKSSHSDSDLSELSASAKKSKKLINERALSPVDVGENEAIPATLAAQFMSVFDSTSLIVPDMPTVTEMGSILLERRKAALRDEYGV